MSQKANYFKLGLFVIGAVAAGVAVLLIVGTGAWFKSRTTIETYFNESVQGLETGAPVKYRGATIGKVTKIIASYNRNSSTGAWNYPIPPDLKNGVNFNWEEWLGSAPQHPFEAERVFRYRKYWDYSGGITTDLFVHLITSIHYILGANMPKSVVATGGILVRHDGRQVPDARLAIAENGGGLIGVEEAVTCITILGH